VVKKPPANTGDTGLILGSGRTPGEGNATPIPVFLPKHPTDRGAWQATVHGFARELDMSLETHQQQYNDKSMPGISSLRLSILYYLHCKTEKKKTLRKHNGKQILYSTISPQI